MSKNILKTNDITMRFGGVTALNNLSIEINEGEIVALIGPNGAGKTTAFNVITGVYAPTAGEVLFEENAIIRNSPRLALTPDRITKLGIARTFQNIRLFKDLTVFENVLIAKHCRSKAGVVSAMFRANYKEEKEMRQSAAELLDIVGLSSAKNEVASSLPYGQQRRLEIARALATKPKLLLLDEPAAGMNPQETDDLSAFIRDIKNKFNLTVFMIEHHMDLVMEISDRIYVLDFGETIAKGTPAEIQNNKRVIDAYLGVQDDA
ncbi:MAG: ABC transporter ATP-binding protein [Hydrogenoanaerobacterium sp.]